MKIIFTKINPYTYKDASPVSDFLHASKILSQENNPPTLHPQSLTIHSNIIFISPLRRCVECIQRFQNQKVFVRKQLSEIPFSIEHIMNADDYAERGSKAIRQAFIEQFLADRLLLSRKVLFGEIKSFLSELRALNKEEVFVVSHSFRLKLFQIYILTNGEIEQNPELMKVHFDVNERTFAFGESFTLEV